MVSPKKKIQMGSHATTLAENHDMSNVYTNRYGDRSKNQKVNHPILSMQMNSFKKRPSLHSSHLGQPEPSSQTVHSTATKAQGDSEELKSKHKMERSESGFRRITRFLGWS